ncbi:hypothetical protein DFH29DRAFT_362357 [Suillus ampliporus]|nr:hypothetical protein DFH29DRAFT_362357 [Suillus ampliporus]
MFLHFARFVTLLFILALAIVVLGISAHLIAIRPTDYWRFAALAVAVSSLTILSFPIILIATWGKRHSDWLIGEALWLTIMWILWLSTGANATRAARTHFFSGACAFFTGYPNQICNEFKVVEAFSYIIFIILLCFMVALMVIACISGEETTRAQETKQPRDLEDSGVGNQGQQHQPQGQQHRLAPLSDITNAPRGQQPPHELLPPLSFMRPE